jgi:5,10-methylenetetrahydromethanopterin reductase
MTGVIGHIPNPNRSQVVELAQAAERAGAGWIGLADAFWWRDVWMLLESVANATETIHIGPAMTNAYMRHNFHTAAALATLHEVAPERVFCGITAGGSEVTVAAGISRSDAAARSMALVQLLRDVSNGDPLDEASGRRLDVALPTTPILMAGRGNQMLAAAGTVADRVLLWAIPLSDLGRSVAEVRRAAHAVGREPQLVWAPVVRHADVPALSLGHPAVYAALNTAVSIRQEWGLDAATVEAIRAALVGGQLEEAIDMIPMPALHDLVIDPADDEMVVAQARRLGIDEIAVPGFAAATVPGHLAWAQTIEARL